MKNFLSNFGVSQVLSSLSPAMGSFAWGQFSGESLTYPFRPLPPFLVSIPTPHLVPRSASPVEAVIDFGSWPMFHLPMHHLNWGLQMQGPPSIRAKIIMWLQFYCCISPFCFFVWKIQKIHEIKILNLLKAFGCFRYTSKTLSLT